jgi:hypothetical protein
MRHYRQDYKKPPLRILGVDGEGLGRAPHRYTFLAAGIDDSDKTYRKSQWSIEKTTGLSTVECLDFLLSLPRNSLIIGFAFVYDLTKILQDLPNRAIYDLFREEERQFIRDGRVLYHPVKWGHYTLNRCNRKFSVRSGKKRAAVWDVFAFFQSSFVKAISKWEVAPKDAIARIAEMKEKRAVLESQPFDKVRDYCFEECRYLSRLGGALLKAHSDVGLTLKSYHGAGSTASVILTKFGIAEKRGTFPEEMRDALARAFFGGRFENSVVGVVEGRIYGYDIASAYPYQIHSLPCLECGQWRKVDRPDHATIERATLALVHWHDPGSHVTLVRAWGVLPVRARDGTIIFPVGAAGGWTWQREYLHAATMAPSLWASEAWIYETDCGHLPFTGIAEIYRQRIGLGKDARGIVLKLGPNSVYGKVAQSKGVNPPFQSWVWAGNITSGTRAQLLQAIACAPNPWDVLMVATDGIWSRVPLDLPKPLDTGTSDLPDPLGSWTQKNFENGVFVARPGIYFPLNPTEEQIDDCRGRGLGKKTVYEQWRKIVDAWEAGESTIKIGDLQRFVGAKTGITYGEKSGYTRSADYGEWIEHSVKVSFQSEPKRDYAMPDNRLATWRNVGWESEPYKAAIESPEAKLLRLAQEIADEQPDYDFGDM